MQLSQALRAEPQVSDPFEQLFRALRLRLPVMSAEGYAETRVRELHAEWPVLGGSIRLINGGTLARWAEGEKMLSPIRPYQDTYRQEIHRSLWSVISELHARGRTNEQIAALMESHGL